MTYVFGEFEFDEGLYELRRAGTAIKLEPKVYDVLAFLIRHRERVVSKAELLDALWPGEFVSESVLPRCITAARKALGDTRERPEVIATVHGRGYRFVAAVQAHSPEDAPPRAAAREAPPAGLFVGRAAVMAQLETALDDAAAGQGRLVLLVGEPGIGKTRTAEEVAGHAQRRDVLLLSGRCYEGEGAPAFWPWVQILRTAVRARDGAGLRAELGAGAADVAQLVPDLRAQLDDIPATEVIASDQARFRLFDSISQFLQRVSVKQPLLLVLDDLHWADAPSLLLLQFLAREMRRARILVLGTYRDVELRRDHPLAQVLGDLAREPLCQRIVLRGLDAPAVERCVETATGRAPSPALVSAVTEMTGGNPFFVGQIAQWLATDSAAQLPSADGSWSLLLPQGIREAIGRRLNALSPTCNRVLAVASVLGRDFDVRVLDAVCGRAFATPDDGSLRQAKIEALLAHLDEAAAARILLQLPSAPGRYGFTHALIRQTLYEELTTVERVRLHRDVAEVMEALYAADVEPHLSELAHHFFQAAPGGDCATAIAYSRRAAERAFRLFAYEEAAEAYARALQLFDVFPPATAEVATQRDVQRAEVLIGLAEAQSLAGQREQSQENCRQVARLARRLGQAALLTRAALVFGQRAELGPLPADELCALLEEALATLGDAHPGWRARVLSRLTGTVPYQNSMATRAALSREAVELATRAGDATALSDALGARLWSLLGPDDDEARLRAADEVLRHAEGSGQRELILLAREHRVRTFLSQADLAAADREDEVYLALAQELRQGTYLYFSAVYRTARALGDGRFAEAEALMRDCLAIGQRVQHPAATPVLLWQTYWMLRQRGEIEAFEARVVAAGRAYPLDQPLPPALSDPQQRAAGMEILVQRYAFEGPFLRSTLAFGDSQTGRLDSARAHFDDLAAQEFADIPRDEWWMATTSQLAETCAALGDAPRASLLYLQLEPFAARNAAHSLLRTYAGSTHYFLGLLAAAMARAGDAAAHFDAALAANTGLGARPALVHTQYAYARLLAAGERRGDRAKLLSLLTAAEATAQELGMAGLSHRLTQLRSSRKAQEIIRRP